jgi:sec-independent protein translocase protein TatB
MFDFAWSEIGVIAVVALIAIGPKDMPVAIRAATGWLKKARRMAAEFQTHVDEMVREANLDEVRDQINELRNFDVKSMVEETVDPDHSLRDTFSSNPLEPTPAMRTGDAATAVESESIGDVAVAELDRPEEMAAAPDAVASGDPAAPAFSPPALTAAIADANTEPEAPAFIPPAIARRSGSRAAL